MRHALALVTIFVLTACRGRVPPADLLEPRERLLEATVGGRNKEWVEGQSGKPIRIHDVVRRTLPASPPSRFDFQVKVPAGGRLSLACGVPEDHHGEPGVEFLVKVKSG